jgi:hypothetical protein
MALSLQDVTSSAAKKKKAQLTKTPSNKKTLYPWEGEENMASDVRTFSAKQAVIRARKIVEKNNVIVENLRDDYVSKSSITKLEEELKGRNDMFRFDEGSFGGDSISVKSEKSLWSSIKGMFKSGSNGRTELDARV